MVKSTERDDGTVPLYRLTGVENMNTWTLPPIGNAVSSAYDAEPPTATGPKLVQVTRFGLPARYPSIGSGTPLPFASVVPEVVPEVAPEVVHEVEPEVVHEVVSPFAPVVVPEVVPTVVPESVPMVVHEVEPEVVPDVVPVVVPDV